MSAGRRWIRNAVAALVPALAACGGDRTGSGGGPDWLTEAARPVTVETSLEVERAASRVIGQDGGTVTATGSDGSRFHLSLPAGALLSPERITLTPIAAVEGLPLGGGSVAAVHIEPSGLQLLDAATLTIRPAQAVPAREQVAFGYYGAGQDAHRYPLSRDTTQIALRILHFSGYGLGRSAPDDPGRMALQRASAAEARLQSRIAEIAERGRGTPEGMEELVGDRLVAALIEYYDTALRPLMLRAESDDRLADCCLARYWSWERNLFFFGANSETTGETGRPQDGTTSDDLQRRRDEAAASSARILENAYNEGIRRAVRLCRENHDLTTVGTLLGLERRRLLFGGDPDGPEAAAFSRAFTEMGDCFQFEVEFSSAFEFRAPGTAFVDEVRASAKVDGSGIAAQVRASAPLEYVRFVATFTGASMIGRSYRTEAAGTRPGTFIVERIELNENLRTEAGTSCDGETEKQQIAATDTVTILMRLLPPTDIVRTIMEGFGSELTVRHGWAESWDDAHAAERVGSAPSSDEDDPDLLYRIVLPGTEPGLWKAEFHEASGDPSGPSTSEDGYLVMRHTPR